MHSHQVWDAQRQQIAILQGFDCKMPDHVVSERLLVESLEHLRDRHFLLLGWKDEVYFSEEIAFQDRDVNDAVLEGQAVPCDPIIDEVDLLYLISLIVKVLVHWA